jgi:hypothetical protein
LRNRTFAQHTERPSSFRFCDDPRKATLTPHQRREAIKRVNAEKETLGEIARSCNVSRWTISRLVN